MLNGRRLCLISKVVVGHSARRRDLELGCIRPRFISSAETIGMVGCSDSIENAVVSVQHDLGLDVLEKLESAVHVGVWEGGRAPGEPVVDVCLHLFQRNPARRHVTKKRGGGGKQVTEGGVG